MTTAFIITSFIIYSTILFFINNWFIILLITLFNLILLIITKCNIKKYIKFFKKNIIFILFIFICNMFYENLITSLLISIKLLLVINLTFIITNKISPYNLSIGFYYLLYPLKIFKLDIKKASLIITISISFIPILSNEAKSIKDSLQSKGFEFNLKNIITKPHIYLITYLNNIFKLIDDLEKTLIMKAYE